MATDTKFVRGADKLRQRVATITRNLSLPPMVEEITELLHRRTLRRFDRQVDPDEKPWKPLKEVTLIRKRRQGFGKQPTLVRKGDLRSSIKVIRGVVGLTFINTGAGSRIGIDNKKVAEYARLHNLGLGGQTRRRFLGIGALDVRATDSLLRRKATELGLD